MEKENDVVVLAKFEDPIEANIVKGMLECNGIVAGVMEESISRGLMMSPTCLMVMRHDLERARALLDLYTPGSPDGVEDHD